MQRTGIVLALALTVCIGLAAEPFRLEIDRSRSYIAATVDKQGFLTRFGAGHKHGVLATEWSAEICLDEREMRNSRAAIKVASDSLRADTPEARKRAGLGADGPGENDVREIQAKMLGPDILAVDQFGEISLTTTDLAASRNGRLDWRGSFTLRGVSKPVTVAAALETSDNRRYRINGWFRVKQSDFGITPVSIAGVVKVKDEIEIRFDLHGALTSNACSSSP